MLGRALQETAADAAWVGWGFVAEDPAFAELCDRLGVVFIGPTAEAMRRLGDKIGSKLLAQEVGVPVAPWSEGGVDTVQDALQAADRIGYPLMLKATAGGGGRGIRKVTGPEELTDAYQRTRDEAQRAFGSGVVFLEKLVTGARHVEVQVIADGQGTAWAIGVRDCSVQRRNQKVIEESASALLEPDQVQELKDAAERLALAVGYRGAGTVEFLYHPGERTFAFLEVNTRLQVEHPITEFVTGFDLVAAQLQVASGQALTGSRPTERGHAVEARLNAEDPDRDFAPAPGRITHLEFPAGPGIRVDTGVAENDTIPADFDSMIAKIIAYGSDREQALARLHRALSETTVVIDGGVSNKSFLLALLGRSEVTQGTPQWADTGWIDRVRAQGELSVDAHSGVALVAAAIEAYVEQERAEIAGFLASSAGGRPQLQHEQSFSTELKLRGRTYAITVWHSGAGRYEVAVQAPGADARTVTAHLDRIDDTHGRLTIEGRRFRIVTASHGPVQLVEVDGVTHRVSRDEGGVLRAPAPALVVATPVAVGADVTAGDPVLVLESMKMETVLPAPVSGKVKELAVRAGRQVEAGTALIRLEPSGADDDTSTDVEDDFTLELPQVQAVGSAAERYDVARRRVISVLLGYDPTSRGLQGVLQDYLDARATYVAEGGEVVAGELQILDLFTDLAEVSRNRPARDGSDLDGSGVHSSREYFHTYLRSLDPDRGALPEAFQDRLTRVLAHYGTDLEGGDRLREALFRISLAQQQHADTDLVIAILQRWLVEAPPADAPQARAIIERVVRVTQRRYVVIGDLARSVRFRWFDQPAVDAERSSVLDGVADEVRALEDPNAPDRAARIDTLSAIPEPLTGFLRDRLYADGAVAPEREEPLLEVLVRRHYLEFEVSQVEPIKLAGRPAVQAPIGTDSTDGTDHVMATIAEIDELAPDSQFLAAVGQVVSQGGSWALDVYARWPEPPADADQVSAYLTEITDAAHFPDAVRRVSVAVCSRGEGAVDYYNLLRGADGSFTEDALVRGMHPMVGRRLNLWRLREFDVTRLDAPQDVLLYQCIAKNNPADRRLVAMSQVRQLAVIRDDDGAVVALPHAERAIEHCLEAIRRVRSASGAAGTRMDVNHVWVTVWPMVDADIDQLTALQEKITPLSEGAGIQEVLAIGRVAGRDGSPVPIAIRFHSRPGAGVVADVIQPPTTALAPIDDYDAKVLRARRRGLVYPYELEAVLAEGGSFVEYDLVPGDGDDPVLAPVDRPRGQNTAGIVVAVVTTPSPLYPEGITRVLLAGDPIKSLGALSEPECARVIAAIDLADSMGVPLEWFAVSAGARVSMNSGTENMDWVAAALKRIVEFTQAGGEINVVVAGINVGAQPYWNAEATMLMHTRGILVMTPDSAMVLTGKQSLDFSGGVSAEDNFGIGGYDRVMGPNGQAQYWVPDLAGAISVLMAHYEQSYVASGEGHPRRARTSDPIDRDVSSAPHEGDFATVGEVFSVAQNPDRKRAFDIRSVMRAVSDQDFPMLERWAGMADAGTAVTVDTRIGGYPVALVGIESKPVQRQGFPPTDGPDTYTAGTLFPRSSKKVARAINAASGNRPVVVLANLSGFDGSPDSMRNLQLEYGAEIGRAIVNFDGPIVFCVISRYHGGAFVVFSKRLNPQMTVLALEGSFASVLGGAPAAAVVFASEVDKRASTDPEVADLERRISEASDAERAPLVVELADLRDRLRAEKIAEVAAEFDGVHNIHRAVEVGSVDEVISVAQLRPKIVEAIERKLGGAARMAAPHTTPTKEQR